MTAGQPPQRPTVTPDADLFASLLPRHLQLIDRIDDAHAKANPSRRVAARSDGRVKMGELSFIMANRVNGVAALHTGLMKTTVFKELNRLHPDRIVNETNGVTPRRWLRLANRCRARSSMWRASGTASSGLSGRTATAASLCAGLKSTCSPGSARSRSTASRRRRCTASAPPSG